MITAVAAALTSAGVAAATAQIIATALVQIGGAIVFNAVAQALRGNPRAEDQAAQLRLATGLPSVRFVYGDTEATGTPAPANVVKDGVLYACYLLNSRPSAGPLDVYIDKRLVTLNGAHDPYDFTATGGAEATNDPFAGHLKVWIGLGDQTTAPKQITDEVPYAEGTAEHYFKTSDAWTGCTVVWIRAARGDNSAQRWPSRPPALSARGAFSKLWDPRDVLQDPDDPATWGFSDNQALAVLDALMRNPIAPYHVDNLLIETFKWAADAADQLVDLKSGGSEKRYRVGGTQEFRGAEIEDLIAPLAEAGGSQFIRTGGRLGMVPAVWHAPTLTLTDMVGDGYELRQLARGRDLYQQVTCKYTSAARGYETAELGVWDIPGASGDGGAPKVFDMTLAMVHSPTQAMRLRKIAGLRLRQQRALTSVAPPDFIEAIPGAHVTVSIPGRARLNGDWQLRHAHPAFDLRGEKDGVALRMPFEMVEASAAVFDWDEVTEEEDIIVPPFDADFEGTQPPGSLSVQTGTAVDLDTGGAVVPRIRFAADPSGTGDVTGYEWQWRTHSGTPGDYGAGGTIGPDVRDGSGQVFGFVSAAGPTDFHDIRLRALGPAGSSEWVDIENVVIGTTLDDAAAVAEPGRVRFTGTTPDSSVVKGLRIYRAATGAGFGAAVALTDTISATPGAAYDVIAGDPLAEDEIRNGAFASGSEWTAGGGWAIGAGVAAHTPGAGSWLDQTQSPGVSGDSLRLTFTLSGRTAGSVYARLDGTTDVDGVSHGANGTVSEALTVPMVMTQLRLRASSDFDGAIDDVIAVLDTTACVAQGAADFFIVPVFQTDLEGTPAGPFTRTIP